MDERQAFIMEHEALCQRLRTDFEGQPFACIMVALIRLMVETVESEFGVAAGTTFQNDMRDAYRKVVQYNTN